MVQEEGNAEFQFSVYVSVLFFPYYCRPTFTPFSLGRYFGGFTAISEAEKSEPSTMGQGKNDICSIRN